MILYVASARSARSDAPGRKISSICNTWREMGFSVELVCGGDVCGGWHWHDASGTRAASDGRVASAKRRSRFRSKPAQRGIQMPLVHSVSEYRDMRHDSLLHKHLVARLGQRRPEVIWHRASRLHMAPLRVAQSLGVPYVLEWIDNLINYNLSLFRWKALAADRQRLREANRIAIVSEKWMREVCAQYGLAPERFTVIPNAVDADQFAHEERAGSRVRVQMNIPPDAFVVGYVGSYAWYHESHVMPKAAAKVRERTDRSVYWLLVGDGPDRPRVDRLTRELGLDDTIKRAGTVASDDVPAWLSAMDAAVLPGSLEIICPIKVQEYMAAGVPPIIPDTEANREVVDPGSTGRLFKPKDPASLAEQVVTLSANPSLTRELGRAARQEVLDRFTWRSTWGKALEEVLQGVSDLRCPL